MPHRSLGSMRWEVAQVWVGFGVSEGVEVGLVCGGESNPLKKTVLACSQVP